MMSEIYSNTPLVEGKQEKRILREEGDARVVGEEEGIGVGSEIEGDDYDEEGPIEGETQWEVFFNWSRILHGLKDLMVVVSP